MTQLVSRIFSYFTQKTLTPFPDEFQRRYPGPSSTGGASSPPCPFFVGLTFRNALAEASRQHKFLLVYLHSEEHPNTRPFIEDVLYNPTVLRYLDEHFVLWGCDVCETDGMKCMQQLGATTFPFLCVILRAASRDQPILRCQGQLNVEVLLRALTTCVHDNGAAFIAQRADEQESRLRQHLREQQQAELQAALRADQERERMEQEERDRRDRELREAQEAERRAEEEKDILLERKALALSRVPEEPPEGTPGCVLARIFLRDGSFVERRFLVEDESSTVDTVADFVFSHERHSGSDNFDIATKMPFAVLPRGATLKSLRLPQRAVLVVRDPQPTASKN